MVLVDTSIWISHLHRRESHLEFLLAENRVIGHPLVLEELACGSLQDRSLVIAMYSGLHRLDTIDHEEFLHFLDAHRLMGKGLGLVDVHLLASAQLGHARIWSRDKALMDGAAKLHIAYSCPKERS